MTMLTATLKDMVFRPEEFDIDVTEGGTVNMTLNKSNWDARGQSFVTELTFEKRWQRKPRRCYRNGR